ncbi:MAG TPA: hypothetical protein VHV77_09730 [Pirellulales bacterium]|jgi:ABC-type transporter Mla maintaining outer membrane lipid asymmetry permease subunit MlaE|nr:hypothetical protein [Pirellulales bacterium]
MGSGLSPLELLIIAAVMAILVGIPTLVFIIGMSMFRGGKRDDQ